ncbi:MAG: pirin family protein [Gammaproteobacteria bacterium]|nr:pirin family protein [Gammaproteobacteria bacterium]
MSNLLNHPDHASTEQQGRCPAIEMVLQPRTADLGGFSVRRALPTAKKRSLGPWVFFDEMGPACFPAGQGVDVPPHPHIGLATVTYLFSGEMLHRDSLGSHQRIFPGDINLMVAGSGIVHSERETDAVRQREHAQHGLQLWLALPAEQESMPPAFHHIDAASIPSAEINGVRVRVLMGAAYGFNSPVPVFSPTLYIEASLQAGQRLELPEADERGLYVLKGSVNLNGSVVQQGSMAILGNMQQLEIQSRENTQIVMIGGASLGKRFIEWNFVASRKELIEQAKADWQAGRFPTVPGDEHEFIAYP